jgi:hypothetical protein
MKRSEEHKLQTFNGEIIRLEEETAVVEPNKVEIRGPTNQIFDQFVPLEDKIIKIEVWKKVTE